jgi:hypothetical protein
MQVLCSVLKRMVVVLLATTTLLHANAARAADPTTADCLAANEKSIQLRGQHQFRAARGELLICASEACPGDIRSECARRVTEINRAIPTIIFEAKDSSGKDLTVVKVTMDGETLTERLEGTALSIDPGEHDFAFEASGRSVKRRLVIREAEKERLEQVRWEEPKKNATLLPAPTQTARQQSKPGSGQRTAAVVVGSVGLVGVVVGAIFGVSAKIRYGKSEPFCVNDHCSGQGHSYREGALANADASTLAFVLGGVALGGAGVLWFTAPRSLAPAEARLRLAPVIAKASSAVVLQGVW